MATTYEFDHLMMPDGWRSPGRLTVGDDGMIVAGDETANAERVAGHAIPGLPNLHSHAFQRAMAGLTERAGPGRDSFWTWREVMYGFVERITPEDAEAIATQLYIEMLKAGYTAVGEFHYLHHAPDGSPYDDVAEMSARVAAAASRAGIGMTLLPVLYMTGGFGGAPAGDGQRRFLNDVERFLAIVEDMRAAHADDPQVAVGIAPHSLRAVPPEALAEAAAGLAAMDAAAPIHIHIAEQVKEVDDCLGWSGQRPVAWLLDNAAVDERWCLVHATHMDTGETTALAATGAVAGLCPTTEANLGDGIFPLRAFTSAGGRLGVGSDSHVSVSPVEELRWLEYGQRLTHLERNVAADDATPSTGAALYRRALAGGAQAMARPISALTAGMRADIVVLDANHPALVHRTGDDVVDSYIFAGNTSPVRHVMVGGQWVVRDRRHTIEDAAADAYGRALSRLLDV